MEQSTPEKTILPKLKKKSVSFPEEVEEKDVKNLETINVVLPKTPVAPRSLTRAKSPGTPYHSAENCSKCRFDRLETSSYWLSQIKLAESVGKHFVSAAFFGLAFESKAEVWCFTFSFKILFCLCKLMLFIIVVANFPCFVVRKH